MGTKSKKAPMRAVMEAAVDACYWTAGAPILGILLGTCMLIGWAMEALWWGYSKARTHRDGQRARSALANR